MNFVIKGTSIFRELDPSVDKSERWKIELIGTEPKYQWTKLLEYPLLRIWLRLPVMTHKPRRCKKFVAVLGDELSKRVSKIENVDLTKQVEQALRGRRTGEDVTAKKLREYPL